MWSRTYGGPGDEEPRSLIATPDGGYVIAGFTGSVNSVSGRDFWLVKTDAPGNIQWNKTFGGAGNDMASSVVATSDGGYAIAGSWNYSRTYEFNNYIGGDFWLIKTDGLGNVQWNRTYGGAGSDMASSLVASSDGGYAIAGTWNYSSYYGLGYTGDFWLVKTDALGNMEWNRTYVSGSVESLVATVDGGYAIAGFAPPLGGVLLVKTDALGNMQWSQTYDGGGWWESVSLVSTSDGGYALASFTLVLEPNNTTEAFWLAKTDSSGNIQWSKIYGGGVFDIAYSLVAASDGGYAVGASRSGDFWLIKTDAVGNTLWNRTYGGTGTEVAYSLIVTSDGGYAIAGWTDSFGAGGEDFWLVKTDGTGVVPEFSSWLIPSVLLLATTLIVVKKKTLFHKRSK